VEHEIPAERLHELFMLLVHAGGLLHPETAAPGHGLTLSQAFALHALDTDPPLSQNDLAERLRLEKSSVSRMVAEMERKELLARERDPGNRRFYRLRLTDRGRKLHRSMATSFHGRFGRWAAAMTADERRSLYVGLSGMLRAMRE
jgi:DNA-binding MarR family transcriptional regulator